MIGVVYCVAYLRLMVPCELPLPLAPEPQPFHYGKATNRSDLANARVLRPYWPEALPTPKDRPEVVLPPQPKRKQTKPQEQTMVASYAPSRGLAKVVQTKVPKGLFVRSDGNEQTDCLPNNKRLWAAMKKVRNNFGKPLIIESAYRSPEYNAALRKKSNGVAKNSQHMKCAAIDFRIDGVSIGRLARYVRSLPEIGGVGVYKGWVHMDTGNYRNW